VAGGKENTHGLAPKASEAQDILSRTRLFKLLIGAKGVEADILTIILVC